MYRALLAVALVVAATAAYGQFNQCGRGFCPGGINGAGFSAPSGSIIPSGNFRITNTPNFRITNTGDFRIVASGAGGSAALLIDNSSTALLVDNTNSACLVGGGC